MKIKKIILLILIFCIIICVYYFNLDRAEIVIHQLNNRNFSIINGKCISKIDNSVVPLKILDNLLSWVNLHETNWSHKILDGFWKPSECKSNQSLAIIIPYRSREIHLKKLLGHLHPFLQKQMVEYQIIVIEQSQHGIFNKGALINIGIKEAMSMPKRSFTCFVIHDVDMLPIMENNIYQCLDNPLHLGAAVDKYNYNLVYSQIVGGVLAMTKDQLVKVNGFSNIYEGWGGEDDDMTERIRLEKLKIVRYPIDVSKYNMIKHKGDRGNPPNDERFYYLNRAERRYKFDGLNTIFYTKLNKSKTKTHLAHWLHVELPPKTYFIKREF